MRVILSAAMGLNSHVATLQEKVRKKSTEKEVDFEVSDNGCTLAHFCNTAVQHATRSNCLLCLLHFTRHGEYHSSACSKSEFALVIA